MSPLQSTAAIRRPVAGRAHYRPRLVEWRQVRSERPSPSPGSSSSRHASWSGSPVSMKGSSHVSTSGSRHRCCQRVRVDQSHSKADHDACDWVVRSTRRPSETGRIRRHVGPIRMDPAVFVTKSWTNVPRMARSRAVWSTTSNQDSYWRSPSLASSGSINFNPVNRPRVEQALGLSRCRDRGGPHRRSGGGPSGAPVPPGSDRRWRLLRIGGGVVMLLFLAAAVVYPRSSTTAIPVRGLRRVQPGLEPDRPRTPQPVHDDLSGTTPSTKATSSSSSGRSR